jgi:hypothetical protein
VARIELSVWSEQSREPGVATIEKRAGLARIEQRVGVARIEQRVGSGQNRAESWVRLE